MADTLTLTPAKDFNVNNRAVKEQCLAMESDVKAFLDYLNRNYGGNKYFSVRMHLDKVLKKHYAEQDIVRMNARPSIPFVIAKLAAFASRILDAEAKLYWNNSCGWCVSVRDSRSTYSLTFRQDGEGYNIDGYGEARTTTNDGIGRLHSYYGSRNLGACKKFKDMYYLIAEVRYDMDDPVVDTCVVSVPFATRKDAEDYLKVFKEAKSPVAMVSPFLPPHMAVDAVWDVRIVEPELS